jgi:hypothetical protein
MFGKLVSVRSRAKPTCDTEEERDTLYNIATLVPFILYEAL